MNNNFTKNSAILIKISAIIFIFFILITSAISCMSLKDLNSYITYTIKERLTNTKDTSLNDFEKGEEIMLPNPKLESKVSLEEALNNRRSVRNFSSKELSIEEVSQLLWAAQGITKENTGFRTAPSAGALYPLELFIIKSDGAFHYIPDEHKLIKLTSEDLRSNLAQGASFQDFIADASINIIITAIYERTTTKYGDRGTRYVHMEAGHCCQNILLQAQALSLGAVPIGAFDDSYIQKLLNLPEDYVPLYIVPVGHKAE